MILFLAPYFEKKPWAGYELNKIYDCPCGTGEAWLVSGLKNKSSIITNGKYRGKSLRYLWTSHKELFGDFNEKEFPILIKLISANQDLSLQVHPNDEYALKKHNKLGKFECWYVLPQNQAVDTIIGLNVKNAVELKKIIDNNQIEKFICKKKIKPNDLIVIEPGKIHALTKGSFVLEVQESSDITYRLYDFNRFPKRELNINDSLKVIDYNNKKNNIYDFTKPDIYKNKFFSFEKLIINGVSKITNESFKIIYILEGFGIINCSNVKKGDSLIITYEDDSINVEGNLTIIEITPKLKKEERLKVRKTALITGLVSQDGYYLSELLLDKGYEVHGIVQSENQLLSSKLNKYMSSSFFYYHVGDLTDTSNINRILESVKPDEIYHLACQSHVDYSFDMPEYTAQVNALGTLRLLDAIKSNEIQTKMFNLSSCYLFDGENFPQNENTRFNPKSPYAVSKLFAYYSVVNYRENYDLYCVNGICYNQTSPIDDISAIPRKVISAVKKIKNKEKVILELGNLNAKREWGHAKDYATVMWKILQLDNPKDYIISTGKSISVRELVERTYRYINIDINWQGTGLDEVGINEKTGEVLVKINPKFFRPYDENELVGNSALLKQDTKYEFQYDIDSLIESMMEDKEC